MVLLAALLDDRALALDAVVDRRRRDTVRWVATSELEDPTPFLAGGEVLLTTGLGTADWSARRWGGYVERLATAGVVAIGLGLGLTYDAVPAALLRAAERYDVDLFAVPRPTAFVAISQALVARLRTEEESAARGAVDAHRELARAALADDPVDAVLARLGRAVGMAAVVAADGALLHGPVGAEQDVFDPGLVADVVARIRPRGLRAAAAESVPGGQIAVHPVGLRGRPTRYLVAGSSALVDDLGRGVVATAVGLLGLVEEQAAAARDADRRLRSLALDRAFAGDLASADLLLSSTSSRRTLPPRAVVLRARGGADALDDGIRLLESLGEVVADGVEGAADELVAVVRDRGAEGRAGRLAAVGLAVGVGEPAAGAALAAGFDTAGRALALTSTETPVVSWAARTDHGILGLLGAGQVDAFRRTFLAPILEAEDGEVLVATLESFVRHHGSVLRVADDLGIHRNTVRHRTERIERLLGRSLADPRTRVDAWVALAGQT